MDDADRERPPSLREVRRGPMMQRCHCCGEKRPWTQFDTITIYYQNGEVLHRGELCSVCIKEDCRPWADDPVCNLPDDMVMR